VVGSHYVDGFIDLDAIPQTLRTILNDRDRLGDIGDSDQVDGIHAICLALRDVSEVDFSRYKSTTVKRRIQRRMAVRGITNLDDYLATLHDDANERSMLAAQILIGVTSFFRDREAWQLFEERELSERVRALPEGQSLRIWVAGCSTGNEAYSMAIATHEAFEKIGRKPRYTIFASDVAEPALDIARSATFPLRIAEDVPPSRLDRWFRLEHDQFVVQGELREHVVFCQHDLTRDPPFSDIDIVSCQNVFIYFNRDTQRHVFEKLHWSLEPNGVLWLGASESTRAAPELWRSTDARLQLHEPVPGGRSTLAQHASPAAPSEPDFLEILGREFAPPSVLVKEDGEIAQTHGEFDHFLTAGEAGAEQVRDELAEMFDGVVNAARLYGRSRPLVVKLEANGTTHVTLRARLVAAHAAVVVSFEPILVRDVDGLDRGELEHELDETRDALRASIEAAEESLEEAFASNEELIAMNAELVSANDALQARQSELNALNDELVSVNEELIATQLELERVVERRTRAFRDICENSLDFILRVDADNRVMFANRRVLDSLQLEESMAIGHSAHEIGIAPGVRDELVEQWELARATGEPQQFFLTSETEPPEYYHGHAIPEFDRDGELISVLSITRDITDDRKAEAERYALKQRLMQAERLESLALMAGGVAHDFNNILVGVLGMASLVREELDDDDPHAADLDTVIESARLASNVANQLLAYAGRSTVMREDVFAADVVKEVVNLVDARLGGAVELTHVVPPGVGVHVDRTQLSEALSNLMINAGEAALAAEAKRDAPTATATVSVSVATHRGRAPADEEVFHPLTPFERGDWLVFEVRDNGAGIPEDVRERMFDPFFSSKSSGRGLGLPMVIGFVRAHDGLLSLVTEAGRGTSFRIYLPRKDDVSISEVIEDDEEIPNLQGTRVLVVEDEEVVRKYLERCLQRAGAQTVGCSSATEALEFLESAEAQIDVLHLDLGLGDDSGLDLLHDIREKRGHVPALIYSGYDADEVAQKAASLPAVSVLQKPVDPRRHLLTLNQLLKS
jgi:two-component system CheB/CheR fusion protein